MVLRGFRDPKDLVIPFRVSGWRAMVVMGGFGVLKGFPDPKDPVMPFRVTGWCPWWGWMGLVVPEGFQALMVPRSHYGRGVVDGVGGPRGISGPKGPTIPFRVSGWGVCWWWMELVVPEGFQALMVPRSHYGCGVVDGVGGPGGISDPKDPMIPFRVSVWCLWW